jgi:mycofactocin system transcriptional regulator
MEDGRRQHAVTTSARIGRAPATTHGELSTIALALFLERGYDKTTVDDIAAAAGIGRRTLFRYFPSKNDLPWGDFDALLTVMRGHLADLRPDLPVMEALRTAIIEFNRFPPDQIELHRERMRLLLEVPALIAHSSLRYQEWRTAVAEYVARRVGGDVDDLEPQTVAWACLGLCLSAYQEWLHHDSEDLLVLIDRAFRHLEDSFTPSVDRSSEGPAG